MLFQDKLISMSNNYIHKVDDVVYFFICINGFYCLIEIILHCLKNCLVIHNSTIATYLPIFLRMLNIFVTSLVYYILHFFNKKISYTIF